MAMAAHPDRTMTPFWLCIGLVVLGLAIAVIFLAAKAWSDWRVRKEETVRVALAEAAAAAAVEPFRRIARRSPGLALEVLATHARQEPHVQELLVAVDGLRRVRSLASSRLVRRRVRAAVLLGLGLPIPTHEAVSLLGRLAADARTTVREAAARAVGARAEVGAGAALLASMERYRDLSLYRVVRYALRRCGEGVTDVLVGGLSSDVPEIRWLCLDVLGDIGDRRALPALLGYAEREGEDVEGITRVARALRSMASPDATACLLRLARHPAWPVRAQAARSLGLVIARSQGAHADVDVVVERLGQLASDREYWVRNNAVEALARLGGPGRRALERLARCSDRYAQERAREALQTLAVFEGRFRSVDDARHLPDTPSPS
jgi:HEAT repeat protein